MEDEIRVRIVQRARSKCYTAEWVDPVTGKAKSRSTKIKIIESPKRAADQAKRDALTWAENFQEQLREGMADGAHTPWSEFRERYIDEELSDLAHNSLVGACATLNAVEEIIKPKSIQVMNSQQVARFRREIRKRTVRKRVDGQWVEQPLRPASVNRHLRHLKAALRWAKRVGLIRTVPEIQMIRRTGIGAKSRAVTGEEFERMLAACETVCTGGLVDDFKFLLRGLWLSGLRITEALNLRWDRGPVALTYEKGVPIIIFQPEGHKNGKLQRCPCTPDFAELLATVPEGEREGFVFALEDDRRTRDAVGLTISRIGEKARVRTMEESDKWASAHDLRRSFGVRWAAKVQPAVLMRLMRHSTIQTTMKFYVGQETESVISALYGDTKPTTKPGKSEKPSEMASH